MPGRALSPKGFTRRCHERRLQPVEPDLRNDPELRSAWLSLQLHWLASVPGYRDIVKARVAEAARRAELASQRVEKYHEDKDYLGREVDGCG